jgi:mono/diheme cytochrome c family protein
MREGNFGSLFKTLTLVALLALLGAFALAGCGSDSGTTTNETTFSEKEPEPEPSKGAEEGAEEEKEAEAEESEGGKEGEEGGAQLAAGKTVFTTNCAGCHTLADADASGTVGPNLDELQPDEATVQHQVEVGGGPMPAFKGTLSGEEITNVAEYVSTVAGK